jgi:ABC-type amino acid transport substrate-binding protein
MSDFIGTGRTLSIRMAWALLVALLAPAVSAQAVTVAEIKKRGELRHLGVPYANFVTGAGDGMDVEIVQLFAKRLGVKYVYVATDWKNVLPDLVGKEVKAKGKDVEILGDHPVKGDLVANGLTILPWREKVVRFTKPYFPTQVWLVARADAALSPIKPTGDITKDIATTKALLESRPVLALENTCLDPKLYNLSETKANIMLFKGQLNELAPAIMNKESDTTILDVPDALVALAKWPGEIKIIGPISATQEMAVGFAKDSDDLRGEFEKFLDELKRDGTYLKIVKKYYPSVFNYYPDFFKGAK